MDLCRVKYLYVCLQAYEACGPLEIDSALKTLQTLKSELQDAQMSVIEGQLKPLPGENVSICQYMISSLFRSYQIMFICCYLHSWRNVLKIWEAHLRLWDLQWHSC